MQECSILPVAASGLSGFRIAGLEPRVDGSDPAAFPVQLSLDRLNGNRFTMTAISATSAAPEPLSIALLGTGLIAVGVVRRRRRRSA